LKALRNEVNQSIKKSKLS